VIKQIEAEEKMFGNILVPDMGKEKPMIGLIISAGPGTYTNTGVLIPMSVKAGDTVFYPTFGGTKITWESEEYIVVKDADLLAILKEEPKVPPSVLDGNLVHELLSDTKSNMDIDVVPTLLNKIN
jgi:chaperonin GroES